MKVLLIYPPLTLHELDVSPPTKSALIGLGYVAAALKNEGYTVKIIDCLISSFSKQPIDVNFVRYGMIDSEIYKAIASFAPDVVGVSIILP